MMNRYFKVLSLIISSIAVLIILFFYIKWINIPSDVVNEIYSHGYSGTDPEAIQFSNLVQQYKEDHYDKPQVRWKYSNHNWEVVSDFYLYSDEDGSVANVIVLFTSFKVDSDSRFYLTSNMHEILDFGEVQIINGINRE